MPNSGRRRVLILVTIVVEALFLFAAFETVVTLLAVPGAAQNEGMGGPTLWIPWFVGWTAVRVAAGTSAMMIRQPAFWMLPLAVLLWEIRLFQIGWRSTMNGLSGLLDVTPDVSPFILGGPMQALLIPTLVPFVFAPLLALQSYWLFAEWWRRHAV